MGGVVSRCSDKKTSSAAVIHYPFGGSVSASRKTFTPVLNEYKALASDQLIPDRSVRHPRVLSVACGFGEDALFYRSVLGDKSVIVGIDVKPRFQAVAEMERDKQTSFKLHDASHITLEPEFDLITMRHPEPVANPDLWTGIFVTVALFAQKAGAPILMTTFAEHERRFFIDIANMMDSKKGVQLIKQSTNLHSPRNKDALGNDWGRDHYIAVFKPKPLLASCSEQPLG